MGGLARWRYLCRICRPSLEFARLAAVNQNQVTAKSTNLPSRHSELERTLLLAFHPHERDWMRTSANVKSNFPVVRNEGWKRSCHCPDVIRISAFGSGKPLQRQSGGTSSA